MQWQPGRPDQQSWGQQGQTEGRSPAATGIVGATANMATLRHRSSAAQESRGMWGWWIRLTTPTMRPEMLDDRRTREHQRRAELTSIVAPFVLLSTSLLIQQALVDPITAVGIIASCLMMVSALVLNRLGAQVPAALLLVLGIDLPVEWTLILAHGGLGAAWLPAFDLFVIPLIAAGFLLSRRYIPVIVALHIAVILGDYYFLPKNADLAPLIQTWGTGVVFQRAIIIQVLGGVLGFVAARSVDQAIARADRAEDLAAMEHQLAEQKQQLDEGIRKILETHVRVANGDFNARAPLNPDNVLFQIASSLNNLLNRLGRASQAEHVLQRTIAEVGRLRDSLLAARAGRQPLWPAPSGTPVDGLIEVLALPAPLRQGQSANLPGSDQTGGQLPPPYPGQPSGPRGMPGQSSGTYGAPSGPRGMPGQPSGPQGWRGEGMAPNTGPVAPMPESPWTMPELPPVPLPDWLTPDDPTTRRE